MEHEHLPQRAGKNLRRSIGRVDVSHLEQSRTPVLYVCGRAHPNVIAVNMRATHRFFLLVCALPTLSRANDIIVWPKLWCFWIGSTGDPCVLCDPPGLGHCSSKNRRCPDNYGDATTCNSRVCGSANKPTCNYGTCATSDIRAGPHNTKNSHNCSCEPGFIGTPSITSPEGDCNKCIDDARYEYPNCTTYQPYRAGYTALIDNDCPTETLSNDWCADAFDMGAVDETIESKCADTHVGVPTEFDNSFPSVASTLRNSLKIPYWLLCPWECNRCKTAGMYYGEYQAATAMPMQCAFGRINAHSMTVGCAFEYENEGGFIANPAITMDIQDDWTPNCGNSIPNYCNLSTESIDALNAMLTKCCEGYSLCTVMTSGYDGPVSFSCLTDSSIPPLSLSTPNSDLVECAYQTQLSVECPSKPPPTATTTVTTTTVTTTTVTTTTTEISCNAGQRLDDATNACVTCPHGQYQTSLSHTARECMKHHSCNESNMEVIFGGLDEATYPQICMEIGDVSQCPDDKTYWHPGNVAEFISLVKARKPWQLQKQGGPEFTDMSIAAHAVSDALGKYNPGGTIEHADVIKEYLNELDSKVTQNKTFPALMCIEVTQECGVDNDLVYEKAPNTATSDRICEKCPYVANLDTYNALVYSDSGGDACPNTDRPFNDGECLLPSMVETTARPIKNNRCCRVTKIGSMIYDPLLKQIRFDESASLMNDDYKPVYQTNMSSCEHRRGNFVYKSTTTATTTTATATTATAPTVPAPATAKATTTITTTTPTPTTTLKSHKRRNRKIGYWVQGGLMVVLLVMLLSGKCTCIERLHEPQP